MARRVAVANLRYSPRVTSYLPAANRRTLTLCSGPSIASRPLSSSGDPIMKEPLGKALSPDNRGNREMI